jgi:hypothetical protein
MSVAANDAVVKVMESRWLPQKAAIGARSVFRELDKIGLHIRELDPLFL